MTPTVPSAKALPPAIELHGLTHRCSAGMPLLEDIELCIASGELVILAGPNGSGKTTLLRHLNGLLRPSAGELFIHGRPVDKHLAWARQQVGMVFQEADWQIVGQSVAADVAFGPENLRLSRAEIESRVAASLTAVGLQGYGARDPQALSGGEKRRLAIAGILAMQPRIVVMDEPFANLDYPGMLQVRDQIRALRGAGHTQLVATHNLEPLIEEADRLLILAGGRLVWDGPPLQGAAQAERFGLRPLCACRQQALSLSAP